MFWLLAAIGAVTAMYLAFNLIRLVIARVKRRYRPRNAAWSLFWQAACLAVFALAAYISIGEVYGGTSLPLALAVLQTLTAIILLCSVRRQLQTTDAHAAPRVADSLLPTVTVAVPARNEDAQLEACLTSILSSNYPKLEILVLDDCSHDRTPDIIRGFAQAGVRFIGGNEPSNGWLAKNQAYDKLATSASGELILFCGVDVRLAPQTIRQVVALRADKHKSMITILPQNRSLTAVPVLQSMRYYWEMAPPRRLFRRPPVLSSCWLVERTLLNAAGGFAAIRRSVTPEAHFAHQAMLVNDGYSFIRSNTKLGIYSEKPVNEQQETALYSRYPQLHRRPELVMLLTLTELVLLLGPLAVLLHSLLASTPLYIPTLALIALVLHSAAFGAIQRAVYPRISIWRCCLAFLPAIWNDIVYLNLSMYKYEFSQVYWKGRVVSLPVMRRDKHL